MRVRPELAQMVAFQQLNLLANQWQLNGPFDAIFCRNVMIYFDKETQEKILRRFVPLLKPGPDVCRTLRKLQPNQPGILFARSDCLWPRQGEVMNKIRVLSVDDSALMRQLMTEIINSHPDMEMVATAPIRWWRVISLKIQPGRADAGC